jgi:hypothetical protein
LRPSDEETNLAEHTAREGQDPGAETKAARLQGVVPELAE